MKNEILDYLEETKNQKTKYNLFITREEKKSYMKKSKEISLLISEKANKDNTSVENMLIDLYSEGELKAIELITFFQKVTINNTKSVFNRNFNKNFLLKLNKILIESNYKSSLMSDFFDAIFFYVEKTVEEEISQLDSDEKIVKEESLFRILNNFICDYYNLKIKDDKTEETICNYLRRHEDYYFIANILNKAFMSNKNLERYENYVKALNDKYKYLLANIIPIHFMYCCDERPYKCIRHFTGRHDLFTPLDKSEAIESFIKKSTFKAIQMERYANAQKFINIKKILLPFVEKFNESQMNFSNNSILLELFDMRAGHLSLKTLSFIKYFLEKDEVKTKSEIKEYLQSIDNEIKVSNLAKRKRNQLNYRSLKEMGLINEEVKFRLGRNVVDITVIDKIDIFDFHCKDLMLFDKRNIKSFLAIKMINETMPEKIKEYSDSDDDKMRFSPEEIEWLEMNLAY